MKVVFLHLRKTGGASLSAMLKKHFRKERIFPSIHPKAFEFVLANDLKRYTYFWGHFDKSCVDSIPGHKKVISILRDPKSRIISLYRFWRSCSWRMVNRSSIPAKSAAKVLSFKQFLKETSIDVPKYIDNNQVRTFLGPHQVIGENREFIYPKDEVVDRAKSYLDGLDAYAITEYFDQTVPKLFTVIGLSMPKKLLKINVTSSLYDTPNGDVREKQYHNITLDEEDEENLEKLTWADNLLYQYAKQKLILMNELEES